MGIFTTIFSSKPAYFELHLGIEDAANIPLVAGAFEVEWSFKRRRTLGVSGEEESAEGKGRSSRDGNRPGPTPEDTDKERSSRSHNIFRRRRRNTAKSKISSDHQLERTNTTAGSTSSSSTLHDKNVHAIDHAAPSSSSQRLHRSSSTSSTDSNDSRSSSSSASSSLSFRTANSRAHHHTHNSSSLSSTQTDLNRSSSTSKKLKSALPGLTVDGHPLIRTPSGNPLSHQGRGSTARIDIREHACKWGQKVEAGVKIDVVNGNGGAGSAAADGKQVSAKEADSKDDGKGTLGRRGLKIVVHQFLTSSTIGSGPTQLGHLDLDLAEYVGKGRTVRRYLLDGGKTNATIKLTIELVQVAGSTNWVQKEISKGQPAGTGLETLVSSAKQNRANDPDRKIGEVRASITLGSLNASSSDLAGKEGRKPLFSRTKSQSKPSSSDSVSPNPPSISFSSSTLPSNISSTSLSSFHTSPSSSSLHPMNITPAFQDPPSKDSSNKPKIHLHRALQDRERATASTESIIESLFNPRPSVSTSSPDSGGTTEDEPRSSMTAQSVDLHGEAELGGEADEHKGKKGGGLEVWMRRKRKDGEVAGDHAPTTHPRPAKDGQPELGKSLFREDDGLDEGGTEKSPKREKGWKGANKHGKKGKVSRAEED